MTGQPWHFSLADTLAAIEAVRPERAFDYPLRHGTMRVGAYAPHDHDPQSPHDQDELYIIASGTGAFVKDGVRVPFAPNDVLFVEAGATHRFENFGSDFVAWVIFWGPQGGEAGQAG